MNASYSRKWSVFTFFISIIVLYFYVSEGIFSINEWLYHTNGDSLKNYFNVLQVAKHADGFWLNSLNYPFGEQLIFLDSQPLLSKLIGFLSLESFTIAIVNGLPLLSISLATIPLFLIQRELKIPLVTNVLTAIIISFLAPQVTRVSMHFALAYGVYIPLLIYLIIVQFDSDYLKYFLIFLWVLFFSFLHPYYLLIGIVLLSSFLFYHLIIQFSLKKFILNFSAVVLPLIIVKTVLYLTDPILDRPEMPFGIWHFRSTFTGVFIPKFKPFVEIISQLVSLPKGTFEANAYVGVLGLPVLGITIVRLALRFFSKKSIKQIFRTEKFFYIFFASFLIWIFALYTPVRFIIDPLMELIPILKQFRGLGRFGWIFYYVFSIFITINLDTLRLYLKQKTNVFVSSFVFILLIGFWYLDANGSLNNVKDIMAKREYVSFNKSNFLLENEFNELKSQNEFDVILTLPVFTVGSEIENHEGSGYSVYETYILSNKLSIPYVSTFSSRLSTSQFLAVMTIKEKGDFNKILSKTERILIVADINNLNKAEKAILDNSEVLFQKDFMVYARYKSSH